MESTAVEKYQGKIMQGKNVKMQKCMNIKIALITLFSVFYFEQYDHFCSLIWFINKAD